MSYSFKIRAATKAEAKEKVAIEMATIVQQQAVHAVDAELAMASANAFIDVIDGDESSDVVVSMSGSVSWIVDSHIITSAAVSVTAYLSAKEAPNN